MKIYLSIKSIPELKDLEPLHRKKIWRTNFRKAFNHWQTWVGAIFLGIMGSTGALVAESLFQSKADIFGIWRLGVVLVFVVIGVMVFNHIAIQQARQYMKDSVTKEDHTKN